MTEAQITHSNETMTMPKKFHDAFFKVVPYEERPHFLPSQFNNSVHDSSLFERELYKTARHFHDGKSTLKWEMAAVKVNELDTFFMYPADDSEYTLAYDNEDGEEVFDKIDNKLFGLIMTITALEEGSCRDIVEQDFVNLLCNHLSTLYSAIDNCMVNIDTENNAELREELVSMFELIERHTE